MRRIRAAIAHRCAVALLGCLCAMGAAAQDGVTEFDSVADYMRRVARFCQWRPQEKVYLHMDQTGYFKGETIWMKAYVVRHDTGLPTDLSRILYVELLNPHGDVVERRKWPIDNGTAHGDIKVDSIMTTGFYEIRAYTRYMTNWGTQACFSRVIPIFKEPRAEGDYSNPTIDRANYNSRTYTERMSSADQPQQNLVGMNDTLRSRAAKARQARRIRFYPEGGDMVAGLPARVAVAVTDGEGRPVAGAQGKVVNKRGEVLAQCTTDRNGYALVVLAQAAAGLEARFPTSQKDASRGRSDNAPLPQPRAEGCAMQVDATSGDDVSITLRWSPSLHGRLMGYTVMSRGRMVRCDTLRAQAEAATLAWPRTLMGDGVSQITLFDSEGRIWAERMVFVTPTATAAASSIAITSPTALLKPCSRVKFDIQTAPDASLSLSAVDMEGQVNGPHGSMLTWMLLESDLRGYIAHPEYYFEADDTEHRAAADLLMMVQGWRRYDWKLMTGQSTFEKFQPIEDKPYLFGRLRQKTRKGTVEDVWIETTMYNAAGQVVDGLAKTDSIGNYVFEVPELEGEWQMQINTGKADKDGYWKDTEFYVAIDRNFSPVGKFVSPLEAEATPVDTTHTFKWIFSEADERWVSQLDRTRMLQNVTVKAKKRFWDRSNWSNEENAQKHSMLYYNCDDYADRIADEGQEMPTLAEWLTTINSQFSGSETPIEGYTISIDSNLVGNAGQTLKLTLEGKEVDENGDPLTYYRDGLNYAGRPVVWILDNQFFNVTSLPYTGQLDVMFNDAEFHYNNWLPHFLDEARSVYVSDDIDLLHNHYRCPQIDSRKPIILYVYSHRRFLYNQKGLRRTHYQGYNVPSTFQMEDYSDIPPMEDFRRTIYWQPDVKTDGNGHATVEFWNNSTAKEIHVSCEGLAPNGQLLVY